MQAEVKVVPLEQVRPTEVPLDCFVRKMAHVLNTQGQIEPLQVSQSDGEYITRAQDAWANEIVCAARQLGWDTLLVCVRVK